MTSHCSAVQKKKNGTESVKTIRPLCARLFLGQHQFLRWIRLQGVTGPVTSKLPATSHTDWLVGLELQTLKCLCNICPSRQRSLDFFIGWKCCCVDSSFHHHLQSWSSSWILWLLSTGFKNVLQVFYAPSSGPRPLFVLKARCCRIFITQSLCSSGWSVKE